DRDPAVDHELAEAIRRQGRVILGSHLVEIPLEGSSGARAGTVELRLPIAPLREAAAGVGLMMLPPVSVQRRLYTGAPDQESAVWIAARIAGAPLGSGHGERLRERWLNYYGPAYHFTPVSLSRALRPDGVPPDFFRGKTVFVGGHPGIFPSEKFATPYCRFLKDSGDRYENAVSAGVEVQATAFLNLKRGEWLSRAPTHW